MSDVEKRPADADLIPCDLREFEQLFGYWLDMNSERVQAGGAGDVEDLARRCLSWRISAKMKFTVITPCLNCETMLPSCLDSVAVQTHSDIEHIIVDGASKDRTVAVARQYPHVARIVSEPDRGLYDAMNKGIELATGDFIVFLNADDRFATPNTLSAVEAAIADYPGGDVYYGWLEVRPKCGKPFVFKPPAPVDAPEFMVTGCLPHQSTVTRRKVFEKTGLFDLLYRYHSEYDWFLKILFDDAISVRVIPLVISSFLLGGLSSQLEKGQLEVFEIQNKARLYGTTEWDKRRIELLQQAWLETRAENARLHDMLASTRARPEETTRAFEECCRERDTANHQLSSILRSKSWRLAKAAQSVYHLIRLRHS